MPTMRAKFKVQSVTKHGEQSETVSFAAVAANNYPQDGSDENNTFAKWTPSASCSITVNNPELIGKFEPGQSYYVDFSAV